MAPPIAAFHGRYTPRTEGRAFLARVARRVEAGFITGQPNFRSRYEVVSRSGDELAIRSTNLWTDFNVGLNDIALRLADGAIEYEVAFGRWLRAGLVLGAVIGTGLLLAYVFPLVDGASMAAQLGRAAPGPRGLGDAIFWGSLVWWCVLWPWVLAAFHRRPAEGLLRRVLAEVDAAPS